MSEKYENESSLKLNFEEKLFETENLKRCLEDEKSQLKEELECLKALDSALDKDLENSNDADNDNDNGHNIYKKRLEHSTKEIGFLKKRIQEQHECDLEQMIGKLTFSKLHQGVDWTSNYHCNFSILDFV